ncbi:hypothetical protein H4S08_004470 [Coemansia sp. RSA 1365]|nr:hypothetical protein H4S08_004470 [Coemansia sp. RSA 1365]
MPKLKHMVLNNAPPFGDILFSDYEMPCLEYVSINGGLRMAARFGELAFYASKRMRIDIKEIDKHNNEYLYISTNDLFSKNRRAPYTELLFNHNGFDIDFGRAKWHYLDKLDIFGEIDFNHLLELIIKLPLLDSLNITSLVFSNYEIGMHNQTTQQASSKGVDMLHTNITNLSISCDTDVYSTDLVLSKVMYFVIRMQSLKNLELESEIELPARDLIDRYKDYFPHLANIIVQEGLVFIK